MDTANANNVVYVLREYLKRHATVRLGHARSSSHTPLVHAYDGVFEEAYIRDDHLPRVYEHTVKDGVSDSILIDVRMHGLAEATQKALADVGIDVGDQGAYRFIDIIDAGSNGQTKPNDGISLNPNEDGFWGSVGKIMAIVGFKPDFVKQIAAPLTNQQKGELFGNFAVETQAIATRSANDLVEYARNNGFGADMARTVGALEASQTWAQGHK